MFMVAGIKNEINKILLRLKSRANVIRVGLQGPIIGTDKQRN